MNDFETLVNCEIEDAEKLLTALVRRIRALRNAHVLLRLGVDADQVASDLCHAIRADLHELHLDTEEGALSVIRNRRWVGDRIREMVAEADAQIVRDHARLAKAAGETKQPRRPKDVEERTHTPHEGGNE